MERVSELEHISRVIDCIVLHSQKEYAEKKRAAILSINPKKEYMQGGGIYCKRCGKEKSFDEPERGIFLNCVCDCEYEGWKEQKEREEREFAVRQYKSLNFNELGDVYRKAEFSRLDMSGVTQEFLEAAERCEKFCDRFDRVQITGHGIWLYGAPGVGKTHLAACILNKLETDYLKTCIFTTMDRILSSIKSTFKYTTADTEQGYLRALELCDCLIIDDLGSLKLAKKTESGSFALDKFSDIISRRYDNHRPVVITSNQTIEDMAVSGDLPRRICDRLIERLAIMQVTGESRRIRPKRMEF